MLAACRDPATNDGACTCVPGNVSRIVSAHATTPMDGAALVAALRRHKSDVALGKEARDVKIFDDQLRFALIDFCQPCGHWVHDRMTMEEMFPLDRLDQATSAVCMGLVLRDRTTVYGETRPAACR